MEKEKSLGKFMKEFPDESHADTLPPSNKEKSLSEKIIGINQEVKWIDKKDVREAVLRLKEFVEELYIGEITLVGRELVQEEIDEIFGSKLT